MEASDIFKRVSFIVVIIGIIIMAIGLGGGLISELSVDKKVVQVDCLDSQGHIFKGHTCTEEVSEIIRIFNYIWTIGFLTSLAGILFLISLLLLFNTERSRY